MYYGTPSALIGWGAIQHNHNWANASVIANNKAYGAYDGDDHHADLAGREPHQLLHAALPGLQIGVGYAPKINAAAAGGQAAAGPLDVAGICGFNNATNIEQLPERRLCLAGCCSTSAPTT